VLSDAAQCSRLVLLNAMPFLDVADEFMDGLGASHSRRAAVRWGVNQPLSLPGFRKRALITLVTWCAGG